jgi:hypothetical protein
MKERRDGGRTVQEWGRGCKVEVRDDIGRFRFIRTKRDLL